MKFIIKKRNEELKNKYKEYDEEIKNLKDQLLDVMNKQQKCIIKHLIKYKSINK